MMGFCQGSQDCNSRALAMLANGKYVEDYISCRQLHLWDINQYIIYLWLQHSSNLARLKRYWFSLKEQQATCVWSLSLGTPLQNSAQNSATKLKSCCWLSCQLWHEKELSLLWAQGEAEEQYASYFNPLVSALSFTSGPELSSWVSDVCPGTSDGPSGVMGPGIFSISLTGSCNMNRNFQRKSKYDLLSRWT